MPKIVVRQITDEYNVRVPKVGLDDLQVKEGDQLHFEIFEKDKIVITKLERMGVPA